MGQALREYGRMRRALPFPSTIFQSLPEIATSDCETAITYALFSTSMIK